MEKERPGSRVSSVIDRSTDISVVETLFHTANGYVGVRNAPEEGGGEGSIRGTYLNAFYELTDLTYGEKLYGFPETKQVLVNAPDAQTVILEAGEKQYAMLAPESGEVNQLLDMEAGVAVRTSCWTLGSGARLRLEFRRMASFALPNLFVLCCRATSEGYAGPIRLRSSLRGNVRNHAAPDDPRVAAEPLRCLETSEMGQKDGIGYLTAKTLRSGLSLSCHVAHTCPFTGRWVQRPQEMEEVFTGTLRDGESFELVKYVVYTDSLRFDDPRKAGEALLRKVLEQNPEDLFAQQQSLLSAVRKRAFISLDAPSIMPKALDFALFQLLQSTGSDGVSNVAAKGLSGEGYEGHTFWDSEIYVFPFFAWTQPQKARSMLAYRHAQLGRARANARLLGFSQGALYPWRTINGEECSAYFPAGTAQYHINGDIAYAFLQYWHVTGDMAFMEDMGAEVLVETARMWLELGHMEADGFRIDCVTGPDEYTCLVNNNFYTNAIAQYNLRGAAQMMEQLAKRGLDAKVRARTGVTREEERAFASAAEATYFPKAGSLGISPQDDSFLQKQRLDWKSLPKDHFPLLLHYHPLYLYRYQVCKQADTVLAHLLFPETAPEDVIRRSYAYYDDVTTHDSSLSACVFAMMAALLGLLERARQGFEDTVTLDLLDTHGNTRNGLHTANMGGAYLIMLYGFAGIRADGAGLRLAPVLPEGWTSYAIPFQYQGRRLRCLMHKAEGARLELLEGSELFVSWYGSRTLLRDALRQG
ncbi:MAG: glycosyl hydrolase family 65 protein [Candidatus Limiplasma sp.]|nr:glycosyl hydrolase family 65 protein [Candidatus Limiplasma sp.]